MTTRAFHGINWAEVAARAKADLGDDRIERFSQRMRATALALQASARPDNSVFAPASKLRQQPAADVRAPAIAQSADSETGG
jgi:hypothetical protein